MSGSKFGKEDTSKADTPARPYAKDMETINGLKERLATISADKDSGRITFAQANDKAIRAIRKTRNSKSKTLQTKPLDYLERICHNGWISEAIRKIPELYPYLGHPDLWIRKS